jgi:hypothetical protein
VLNIPFLTNGTDGGIIFLVDNSVFPENNLDELHLGDEGGDAVPLRADTGTTRLEDCFHILSGDRENCFSSIFAEVLSETAEFTMPFSTITKPPLLSSECWELVSYLPCCVKLYAPSV